MYKNLIISTFITLIVLSCTADFDEVNTNPQQTTKMDAKYLFTYSLRRGSLDAYIYQRSQMLYANHYAQYYANSATYFETDRYIPNDNWLTEFWNENFSIYLANIDEAIEISQNENHKNRELLCKIWKVFLFHRITDFWGDVPYFNALKGDKNIEYLTPAYDTQKDIYMDMFANLNYAILNLDESDNTFGDADLIFKGNVSKWVMFANALKLRLAMRISDVMPDSAQKYVQQIVNDGRMMYDNSCSAAMPSEKAGFTYRNQNPLATIAFWSEFRISKTIVRLLDSIGDPRLRIYAEPLNDGTIKGLPNGLSKDQLSQPEYSPGNYSNTGVIFQQLDYPTYLFQYAECCFLMAEAIHKGWISGDVWQYYNKGIVASFEHYGIQNADIQDSYLFSEHVIFNTDKAIQQIITQKYIAIFNDGFEAWAEYRRTGFPKLQPIAAPSGGNTNGVVPLRVPYPFAEKRLNKENYYEAISRLKYGDSMLSPLWWDID